MPQSLIPRIRSARLLFVLVLLLLTIVFNTGCKKNWLDAKPQLSLVVPSTIADYQALLENNNSSGVTFNNGQNGLNEIGAGDFYLTDTIWSANPLVERNIYIWGPDIYMGTTDNIFDWLNPYRRILYTNIVLEGIDKIIPSGSLEQTAWNQVKGSAFFFRAYSHYDIAVEYCKAYDASTSSTDAGIPLRLTSDFNELSKRSTVQQTYDQIIADLKQAERLLPVLTPAPSTDTVLYRVRPNRAAADAVLARVYLSMGDYDNAFVYADKSLQAYNVLIDYNNYPLSTTTAPTLGRFNKEVLFHIVAATYGSLINSRLIVDSILYQSYDANDLRKTTFFTTNGGYLRYKGTYEASANNFMSGPATDEMYLIRAECYARKGNTVAALQDLNTLMVKRWKSSAWTSFTATDATDALKKILVERRKELVYRCLRWVDLRRLNKDPQFAVTLKRVVKGQTYTLPPNDPRYVLPIPDNVILLTGMAQNPR